MPEPATVDPNLARVIAVISTAVVGNLMAVLHNKGLLDREDIAEVVAFTRNGAAGDPHSAVMAGMCADALEHWVRTVGQDN
jgi:hypothetical protein